MKYGLYTRLAGTVLVCNWVTTWALGPDIEPWGWSLWSGFCWSLGVDPVAQVAQMLGECFSFLLVHEQEAGDERLIFFFLFLIKKYH